MISSVAFGFFRHSRADRLLIVRGNQVPGTGINISRADSANRPDLKNIVRLWNEYNRGNPVNGCVCCVLIHRDLHKYDSQGDAPASDKTILISWLSSIRLIPLKTPINMWRPKNIDAQATPCYKISQENKFLPLEW